MCALGWVQNAAIVTMEYVCNLLRMEHKACVRKNPGYRCVLHHPQPHVTFIDTVNRHKCFSCLTIRGGVAAHSSLQRGGWRCVAFSSCSCFRNCCVAMATYSWRGTEKLEWGGSGLKEVQWQWEQWVTQWWQEDSRGYWPKWHRNWWCTVWSEGTELFWRLGD